MRKQMIIALAAATAIVAGGTAYAVDKTETAKPQSNAEDSFLKLSDDGMNAMRDVRKARLDIFNGHTDQAIAEIDNALSDANAAKAQSIALDKIQGMKENAKAGVAKPGVDYLPLYAAISVDENVDLSPNHVDRLTKANLALRTGDTKAAAEALTAVPGDIQYNFASVPLEKLISGVKDAQGQLQDGHFQVANMTLKDIEDSVRYDSFKLSGLSGKMAENTSFATTTPDTGPTVMD